ncbi:uncharacterized protein SCODWIG_00508 [Saccharomycodes ludwigii]|uniref:Altered inheritance of mitochondria protein 23, mitochondrial n=1 Tax=Saccharomycodes ludwigii TaxID=36035 RepID=A0A376B249_9ASCO|nr:uncharacterized protein SCODWIG_00508 [Saccharomycodes ludwigii]
MFLTFALKNYTAILRHRVLLKTINSTTKCYYSDSSLNFANSILFNLGNTASTKNNVRDNKIKYNNNNKDKKNSYNNNNKKYNAKKPKRITVKWSTGTERAQEAANWVLKNIFKASPNGAIKVIDPETNKIVDTNIRIFAKGVNLDEVGFSIVNIFKDEAKGTGIPMVKNVERKIALKNYSDALAVKKSEELLASGAISPNRLGAGMSRLLTSNGTASNANNSEENGLKQIKISWQISELDLHKQKKHEILTQLKKGFKVTLYLDTRDHLNSNKWLSKFDYLDASGKNHDEEENANKEPYFGKISNKELKLRKKTIEELLLMVDEYSNRPIIIGVPEKSMYIKLTPKKNATATEGQDDNVNSNDNNDTNKQLDRYALKELKKKERREKLERKLQRKSETLAKLV